MPCTISIRGRGVCCFLLSSLFALVLHACSTKAKDAEAEPALDSDADDVCHDDGRADRYQEWLDSLFHNDVSPPVANPEARCTGPATGCVKTAVGFESPAMDQVFPLGPVLVGCGVRMECAPAGSKLTVSRFVDSHNVVEILSSPPEALPFEPASKMAHVWFHMDGSSPSMLYLLCTVAGPDSDVPIHASAVRAKAMRQVRHCEPHGQFGAAFVKNAAGGRRYRSDVDWRPPARLEACMRVESCYLGGHRLIGLDTAGARVGTAFTFQISAEEAEVAPFFTGVEAPVAKPHFDSNSYYVRMVGPEIALARVHNVGGGLYNVSVTVTTPGFYLLELWIWATAFNHEDVEGLGATRLTKRQLWGSPHSIRVQATSVAPSVGADGSVASDVSSGPGVTQLTVASRRALLPRCDTMTDATTGRWVSLRDDPSGERGWGPFVTGLARDEYIWEPHHCRLAPVYGDAARTCAGGKVWTIFGDSYARCQAQQLLLDVLSVPEAALGVRFDKHADWRLEQNDAAGLPLSMHLAFGAYNMTQFEDLLAVPADFTLINFGAWMADSSPLHVWEETWQEKVKPMLIESMMAQPLRRVVWAPIYPFPGTKLESRRSNEKIALMNTFAKGVVNEVGIETLDVWAMAMPRLDRACDDSHFSCAHRFGYVRGGVVGLWINAVMLSVLCGGDAGVDGAQV